MCPAIKYKHSHVVPYNDENRVKVLIKTKKKRLYNLCQLFKSLPLILSSSYIKGLVQFC